MSKVLRCLSVLLLVSMGSVFGQTRGVIRYATNPFYPPYDWATPGGGFDGASVELLSLVLPPGVQGLPISEPWKRSLSLAAHGEIDMLLSLRITPDRAKYLAFTSHRAFPNPIVVFVRSGAPISCSRWEQLKPFVGGVSLGDTFGGGFDEYWPDHLTVETAPSMVENFEKLRRGRIDYFVSGLYMGESYLTSQGLTSEIVPLSPAISDQDIYFAFSKLSRWIGLLPALSEALADLDSKGVLEDLLKKHLDRFGSAEAADLFSSRP